MALAISSRRQLKGWFSQSIVNQRNRRNAPGSDDSRRHSVRYQLQALSHVEFHALLDEPHCGDTWVGCDDFLIRAPFYSDILQQRVKSRPDYKGVH